jgi:hypothetical protein
VFAGALERATTATEYRQALERVERYASGRIADRVRKVYAQWPELHDCESGPVALAYFFRVDPEFARTEAGRVSEMISNGVDCDTGVLFAAAKRRMTPSLEIAAINALQDPMAYLQADAVRALGAYGSAKAQQPLWNAFDRWAVAGAIPTGNGPNCPTAEHGTRPAASPVTSSPAVTKGKVVVATADGQVICFG